MELPPRLTKSAADVRSLVAPLLLLAVVVIAINWKMLRDGLIFESHDIHYHLVWLQHFSRELSEGIWYPRWLAGTNYGYGSPTFVFYPPLVYYLGSLLKAVGLNAEQALITLFCLALWGAGVGFYLYAQQRWGRWAALGGALLFITAPYFGFNLYVRGVVPETWGLMAIPLGVWLTDQAIAKPRWIAALALFFAALALTHLPSLILYTLAWVIYCLSFLGRRSWKGVLRVLVAGGLGLGLVSLYLLPALLEQSAVSLNQLSATSGGVAANLVGTPLKENGALMRTQIQPLYLYQVGAIAGLGAVLWFCQRSQPNQPKEIWGWLGTAAALIVLMSYLAVPLWQSSAVLRVIQQPWRLLGLLSFCSAALASLAIHGLISSQKPQQRLILGGAIALLLVGNLLGVYRYSRTAVGFHRPGNVAQAVQAQKWKGKIYTYIQTALSDPYSNQLMDAQEYRPLIEQRVRAPWPELNQPEVSISRGQATVRLDQWNSYQRAFQVTVQSPAQLNVRTYVFPAWQLSVNGQRQPLQMSERGNILLSLEPGTYQVQLRYGWTPAFLVGIGLSLISLGLLAGFWWFFGSGANPGTGSHSASF